MKPRNVFEATRQAVGKGAAAAPDEPIGTGCRAHGCPCNGTVDIGSGGKFYCAWHARAQADKWPAITDALLSHRWLVDFMGELLQLHDSGNPRDWLGKADDFFRTDTRCTPQKAERSRFPLYLWRLREELSWRIGLRKEQPAPRLPQGEEPGFKVRVFAADGVAP